MGRYAAFTHRVIRCNRSASGGRHRFPLFAIALRLMDRRECFATLAALACTDALLTCVAGEGSGVRFWTTRPLPSFVSILRRALTKQSERTGRRCSSFTRSAVRHSRPTATPTQCPQRWLGTGSTCCWWRSNRTACQHPPRRPPTRLGITRTTLIDNADARSSACVRPGQPRAGPYPSQRLLTVQLTPGLFEIVLASERSGGEPEPGSVKFLPRNVPTRTEHGRFELASVAIEALGSLASCSELSFAPSDLFQQLRDRGVELAVLARVALADGRVTATSTGRGCISIVLPSAS